MRWHSFTGRCWRSRAGVGPEWPLVKASIIAGAAFPVAAAVGDLYEAAARLIEQWVRFRSALDRPRFLAVGAIADEVTREVAQQVLPELAAHPRVASFGDGLAVLTKGINATLEADPFQIHLVTSDRLGDQTADQVVCDQIGQEFLFGHFRGFAAQLFHAHRGFEVAQTQFQSPASRI